MRGGNVMRNNLKKSFIVVSILVMMSITIKLDCLTIGFQMIFK